MSVIPTYSDERRRSASLTRLLTLLLCVPLVGNRFFNPAAPESNDSIPQASSTPSVQQSSFGLANALTVPQSEGIAPLPYALPFCEHPGAESSAPAATARGSYEQMTINATLGGDKVRLSDTVSDPLASKSIPPAPELKDGKRRARSGRDDLYVIDNGRDDRVVDFG